MFNPTDIRPANGLTADDRRLLQAIDEAEQRIPRIEPTTVERKLHQQRVRHYTGVKRQHRREQRLERMVAFFRTDRAGRAIRLVCYAVIAWSIAIFAAAFVDWIAR